MRPQHRSHTPTTPTPMSHTPRQAPPTAPTFDLHPPRPRSRAIFGTRTQKQKRPPVRLITSILHAAPPRLGTRTIQRRTRTCGGGANARLADINNHSRLGFVWCIVRQSRGPLRIVRRARHPSFSSRKASVPVMTRTCLPPGYHAARARARGRVRAPDLSEGGLCLMGLQDRCGRRGGAGF